VSEVTLPLDDVRIIFDAVVNSLDWGSGFRI